MEDFLKHLASERESSYAKKVPLKYGFRARLDSKQQRKAKQLNSLYESQVWGSVDDASNQTLRPDEKKLIAEWLHGTPFGQKVLEVGAGSGRFTLPTLKGVDSLMALDREAPNLKALQKKVSPKERNKLKLLCADFAKPVQIKEKFSCVVLIENLLGMNPIFNDRKAILKNAASLLQKKGLLILGYRIHPQVPPGELFYQAMPYDDIYGIAINWSESRLVEEVYQSSTKLSLLTHQEGSPRPAGGKMHFSLFLKE